MCFGEPLTTALTRFTLGFQVRLERLWECDTAMPKLTPLSQTLHLAILATSFLFLHFFPASGGKETLAVLGTPAYYNRASWKMQGVICVIPFTNRVGKDSISSKMTKSDNLDNHDTEQLSAPGRQLLGTLHIGNDMFPQFHQCFYFYQCPGIGICKYDFG
jgi:hypothetical protein